LLPIYTNLTNPDFGKVAEAVYGMAMYSIKAVMHGKAGDVFEMIGENL
jgi:hypothetical protein